MIKLLNEEDAIGLLDKDYVIIVPSKNESYYKNKFLDKNYKVFTINGFLNSQYNGLLSISNDSQNFIFMYKAYLENKENLSKYKNVNSLSFISDLLSTYYSFFDCDLKNNDKVNDLTVIYKSYEKLLLDSRFINRRLLFNEILKNADFNLKYAFLNVQKLTNEELLLIDKMSRKGDVILSIDGYDETLIGRIKSISKDLYYPYDLKKDDDIKMDFFALNDIEEETKYVLNDISKKVINGSSYNDFIIVCKDVTLYEPYFSFVFDFPYSKNSYLGILTSRFIKIFSNILKGDFSCANFISLLKLGVFDISLKDLDKLDNYVYEWNLENESFYTPFTRGTNSLLLDELNSIRQDVIIPLKYLLENIVGQTDAREILKEFWTYLSELKIDEKLFESDPEGYDNFVSLSDDINDYFKAKTTTKDFFDLLNCLSKKIRTKSTFQDEVLVANLSDAAYENKKYIYLMGADSNSFSGTFKPSKLLDSSDFKKDALISKIKEFSSYERAMFKRLSKNENLMVSYHKLSTDLSLKIPSLYLLGNPLKSDDQLYNKRLIIDEYASFLSNKKVNPINTKDEFISKINASYHHDINFKIKENSAIKLYSNHITCSPSSIEAYSKCRFYHFCQYGLKLKIKEKRLFDNREVGSLVHFILENIIKDEKDNISFTNLEDSVKKYAFKYLEDNNKLIDNITRYVVEVLVKSTVMIIKNMASERDISMFKPRYTEFKINDESVVKPITVYFDKGKMTVNGIVDRVDVYETDDKYYYRVIDYKTGGKKLRLDDCLAGLNLQMLLYILAFNESASNITSKKLVASAVLYCPALVKEEKISRKQDEKEIEKSIGKRLIADGIINYDKVVLEALGKDAIGDYIGVITRGKLNDEKIFGLDDLNTLFNGIKDTLKEIGNNILNGNIEVNPVKGRVDACAFCKFNSICSFDKESDPTRKLKNYKNSEVIKLLEGDYNA